MDCSGHINKMSTTFIHGWAVDKSNPNTPLTVSLIIDGHLASTTIAKRPRPDLANKRPAAARSGFIIAIPPQYYDDSAHNIKLEAADGALKLIESHSRILRSADRLDLSSGIIHQGDTLIVGWATSTTSEELIVDLNVDNILLDSKPARRSITRNGDTMKIGFSFNMADHWQHVLCNKPVSIIVAGTDHIVQTISIVDIVRGLNLDNHYVKDNRLFGRLNHPDFFKPIENIAAYIGDKQLTINWEPTTTSSKSHPYTSYSVSLATTDIKNQTVRFLTTLGAHQVGQIQLEAKDSVPESVPRSVRLQDSAAVTNSDPRPTTVNQSGDIMLVNGDFRTWTKGLEISLQAKRVELANNWFFSAKNLANPGKAQLETVTVRDPAHAVRGSSRFGLRLQCELESPAVLEGELNLTSIPNTAKYELAFYLKASNTASLSADLKRVLLLIRENMVDQDGKQRSTTKTLAVLARNLKPTLTGTLIKAKLPELITSQPRTNSSLHIALELNGKIDILIADARIQPINASKPASASMQSTVALEDANIQEQVGILKGIAHWGSQSAITPSCIDNRWAAHAHGSTEINWSSCEYESENVEIIVPVFNAANETLNCLASIERNTLFPHLVTVVDDGSEPETALRLEAFARHKPWIRIIRNTTNLGYTMAANRGLAQSRAKWVVLLNSDTVVSARWLEGLLECAVSDANVAFVGAVSNAASWQSVPQLTDAAGKFKTNSIPYGLSIDDMAQIVERESTRSFPEVPLLNGFCTLMRRSVLDEIGFLDEEAFPVGYGEENDLCVRATNAGYKLRVADHVYIFHVKSVSFGSGRRTELVKMGAEAFKKKHPTVNLREVQAKLQECIPLITLRQKVLAVLDNYSAGVGEQ